MLCKPFSSHLHFLKWLNGAQTVPPFEESLYNFVSLCIAGVIVFSAPACRHPLHRNLNIILKDACYLIFQLISKGI